VNETERRDVIENAHAEGVAAANTLGESLSHKADRRDVWKVAAVHLQAERTAERARVEAEQKSTRDAIGALEEANRDLRARGQQPVPPPPDLDSGEALVAAAAARVLANLPPAPMPTDEQIGNAVASHLVSNPVIVSPVAISSQVSAYLNANPPPAGEKGDRGDKGDQGDPGNDGRDGVDGRAPTPEEIMAVFNQAAAQNPDLLCAGKGKFTEVRGFIQVPPDPAPQERAFWVCLPQ
jgi:hypothetical protein